MKYLPWGMPMQAAFPVDRVLYLSIFTARLSSSGRHSGSFFSLRSGSLPWTRRLQTDRYTGLPDCLPGRLNNTFCVVICLLPSACVPKQQASAQMRTNNTMSILRSLDCLLMNVSFNA
jgi:hypothetical protein